MAGLNYNFKTNSSKTAETTNSSKNTDLNTNDLDIIIAKIAQLKAAPQSTARDAELQNLIAQRNAMGKAIWGN